MENQYKFLGKGTLKIPMNNDSTQIRYWTADDEECFNFNDSEKNPHFSLFERFIEYFGSRGFFTTEDEGVDKLIRKDFWYGKKHDLQFNAHR